MAHGAIGALFRRAFALIARVGQQEHVERRRGAHRFQLLGDRLNCAGDARGILVVDGEEQRGTRFERRPRQRQIDRVGLLAAEQGDEAQRRVERAERDPAEGDRRQDEEQQLQRRRLLDGDHAIELVSEGGRQQSRAGEYRGTWYPIAAAPPRLGRGARLEVLIGHIEGNFRGQQFGAARVGNAANLLSGHSQLAHDFVHR